MKCKYCGCASHCGQSCTNCWECPDCHCHECETEVTTIKYSDDTDARD